ncbi:MULTISPECIES: hypothetical protein [unclassified Klebsiella]|uniref:hypothetical protein n=1 Tax=unclassified Klebsiella TaxID=2608929 RepID=UPI0024DE2377|nr:MULTISPECIES: hypothetical protein [unclassified Klebsiella]MDK1845488.1 hypothetical protein [Klebsiella sp. K5-1]MDK1942844.1 hypothetical protein [Klebsiella sp. K4-32]MDK1970629.1 hypothetical protein [Klebsiella sp. K5-45]MDK2002528.1 hypothetical protein [Klebsiella sp. K4-44]
MSTYKTKNPLGSAAVKDLYDNAENVDKFVNDRTKEELEDRLGVLRKTWHGMEMIFSRFIDYITGRGEQAVAAIGWQELGNWAVGLVVDNRQQIVYYNGSWYKYLGELEHVIAGDSPENDGGVWSAANPTGKWSNIGDAALRSNLGSADGFKWVGKCPDIATLRTIEPSYNGQSIILEKCNADGVLLNVQLHHDPYDIFSPDDGFSVFVTPGGARWKPDLTHGHNVALAGLKRDLSNLADCFDRVRDSIINRIKANGRVNNILCKIMIPSVGFVTNYKVDHPLVYPSIITLTALGNVYIEPKEGMHFQPVVAGDNSQFTSQLTKAMFQSESGWQGAKSKYLNQASARVILDCVGGVFTIRGPGYALEYTADSKGDPIFDADGNPTLDTTGLSIGNMAPCDLDCRDVVVQNVSVIGFNKGFVWGTYNTFICGLRNVYFSRVYDGVTIPDGISNSGERMWYDNVTFGNVARHAFVGLSAGEHTLHNCSVDFVWKDLFYNGPKSACSFVFLSGHIEGVQRYIASKEAPTSYSKASVYISEAVKYDPRRGPGSSADYRGITQMFSAPTNPANPEYGIGLFIEFNAHITAFDGAAPRAEYPCYAGSPLNTGFDIKMKQRRAPGPRYLNTYGPGSKLIHTHIQPAEVNVGKPIDIADPVNPGALFAAIKTGGAVVEYGAASDQNDSIRTIKITLSAATDIVQLFLCNRCRVVSGRNPVWASCSVNVEGMTGQANLTPIMANYQGGEVVVDKTVVPATYYVKPKLVAITQGYPTDMIAMKAKANWTDKFQAMPSSTVLGYWQGADFFVPGFLITGGVGVLILKAPSFWTETENGGY